MLRSYALTDIGRRRQLNQDYIYCSETPVGNLPNLFIVADGMGGHKAGDYASDLAVETVIEEVRASFEKSPEKILNHASAKANGILRKRASEDYALSGMGTTFVAATCIGRFLEVANVGDSRLYVIDKEITQITRDHSLVEELVSLGQLDRAQARTNKNKNIITRAVGGMQVVMADYFETRLKGGEVILMCTDGLTNMVEDSEIMNLVKQKADLTARVDNLIRSANNHGGRDNVGVILIEV